MISHNESEVNTSRLYACCRAERSRAYLDLFLALLGLFFAEDLNRQGRHLQLSMT